MQFSDASVHTISCSSIPTIFHLHWNKYKGNKDKHRKAFWGKPMMVVKGDSEIEDHLLRLRKAQLEQIQFPLGCKIVYSVHSTTKDEVDLLPEIIHGILTDAYLDFETRKVVYRVHHTKEGENHWLLAPEEQLLFGRGSPVWAVPVGKKDIVAATVLQVCILANEDPLYSVQTESNGAIHHYVSKECVHFRKERSSLPFDDTKLAEETSLMKDVPDSDGRSVTTVGTESEQSIFSNKTESIDRVFTPKAETSNPGTKPGEELQSQVCREQSASDAFFVRDNPSPNPKVEVVLNPKESKAEPVECSNTESNADKHQDDAFESQMSHRKRVERDENDDTTTLSSALHLATSTINDSKRRKFENGTGFCCSLLLPKWACESTIKAFLQSTRLRSMLEQKTNCLIKLQSLVVGRPSLPPNPARMYVDIKGPTKQDLDTAVSEVEMLLLLPLRDYKDKLLMMYDLAKCNRSYYRCQGDCVYRCLPPLRTGTVIMDNPPQCRWLCVGYLSPAFVRSRGVKLLIGDRGTGIRQILGGSRCKINIFEAEEEEADNGTSGFVLLGDTSEEVQACVTRAKNRIAWAEKKCLKQA